MSRLEKKVSIITGSSSGIGRAVALKCASEGAIVICGDLEEKGKPEISAETDISTHDLIVQQGGIAEFCKVDVSRAEDITGLVTHTVKKYGRLDMYVVRGSRVFFARPFDVAILAIVNVVKSPLTPQITL